MQTYWPVVSPFQRTEHNKKTEAVKLEKKQITDNTHFSGFAVRTTTASQSGASPAFPHEIWTRIFDLVQPKTLQEEFDTYRNLRQVSRSFRMATEDSFLSRRFLITKALLPTEVLQNFESGGLIKTLQSIPKLFSLSEENRYNQDLQAFLEEHFRKPLKEKPISPASELQHLFDQHIHTVGSVNSHELPEALIKWLKTWQNEGHAFGNGVKSGQAQKQVLYALAREADTFSPEHFNELVAIALKTSTRVRHQFFSELKISQTNRKLLINTLDKQDPNHLNTKLQIQALIRNRASFDESESFKKLLAKIKESNIYHASLLADMENSAGFETVPLLKEPDTLKEMLTDLATL